MKQQYTDLSKMPNIGKTLADKLKTVGINTPDDLKNTGSEDTFIRLKTVDQGACINMLYALEGAIQDIRWHNLDKGKMHEMKEFYDRIK
jgi:DNA transformation protein and related proteins